MQKCVFIAEVIKGRWQSKCNVLITQAQDVRTNEVVAIKKMSYSGKQSTEVRWLLLIDIMLTS